MTDRLHQYELVEIELPLLIYFLICIITDRLHQYELVQVEQTIAVHIGLLKHSHQLRLGILDM